MTASQKTPGSGRTWGLHLVLTVVGAVMAVPLLYAALSGFKSTDELSRNPVGLPESWVASNYTQILGSGDFWRLIGNSTLIAIGTTVLIVAVSALSAFSWFNCWCRTRTSASCVFTLRLGLSEVIGSWKIIAMSRPR